MLSAKYVLRERHNQLRFSFLTSPLKPHHIFGVEDAERLLDATLRKSRLASPYQRIAELLASHRDSLEDRDYYTRRNSYYDPPRTLKGINVVCFLDAKRESLLDVEFSAIVSRNRALSAANIDVGVQFVYMQPEIKVAAGTLKLCVLVAGRKKRMVSKVRLPTDFPSSKLMLTISYTL